MEESIINNKPWYRRWWGLSLLILLLVLLIWLIGLNIWLYLPNLGNEDNSGPANPLAYDLDDDPAWGSIDSRITVISFQDYTCSACAEAYPVLKQVQENYSDKMFFVFRDFPIIGANSTVAALGAECADEQGKFWEMHDKLFQNQELISEEYIRAFASQLELDLTRFNQCLDNQEQQNEVLNDFNEGYAAGVRATPSFFINGRLVSGSLPYAAWEQVVDEYY